MSFIVTATNNGPDSASNIIIKDVIPSGLSNVIVTPSVGVYNSTTGVWTIPSLVNGVNAILNITGTGTAHTTIFNTANKTSQTEYDPTTPDNTTRNQYIPKVDIQVYNYTADDIYDWDVDNAPVLVMDALNNGPDDATGVVCQYVLPVGFSYTTAVIRGNGNYTYDPTTRTVTWNIGFMPDQGAASLDIFVLVNQSGTLTTTASVIHVDQFDSNPSNNVASTDFDVEPAADIQVNQTASNYNPTLNSNVTLTITAGNNGPDQATNINIDDALPSGLSLISATPTTGTYSKGVWTIASLANGANATLTLVVKVTKTGIIKNFAEKDPNTPDQFDWNYNNNGEEVALAVNTTYNPSNDTANIYIDNYNADEVYDWDCYNVPTFVSDVINNGPDDATNVIAQYVLPAGLTFVSADTRMVGNYTYDPSTRTITWYVGYMPKGGATSLDVIVLDTQTGSFTTLAQVIHQDQKNTTETPAYMNITVDDSADVQVTQTASNYNPHVGDNVTLTANVTNNGPDTATNRIVTDTLPAGLNLISFNNYGIGTVTYNATTRTLTWTIPSLNVNSTDTLTLNTQVTGTGTIINNISNDPYSSTQFDWNYNNNSQQTYLNIQN